MKHDTNDNDTREYEAKCWEGPPIVTRAKVARGAVQKTLDREYSSKTNTLKEAYVHWEAMGLETLLEYSGDARVIKAVAAGDGASLLKLQLGDPWQGRTTLWVRDSDIEATASAVTKEGRQDAIRILASRVIDEAMEGQVKKAVKAASRRVAQELKDAFAAYH